MDARRANDRIAEKAKQLRFLSRVPMVCECDAPGCRKIVMISLDEFAQLRSNADDFLTAPGHERENTEVREETPSYTVRRLRHHEGESNGDHDRRSA